MFPLKLVLHREQMNASRGLLQFYLAFCARFMRFFNVLTVGEVVELTEAQLLLSSLVSSSTKPLKVLYLRLSFCNFTSKLVGVFVALEDCWVCRRL